MLLGHDLTNEEFVIDWFKKNKANALASLDKDKEAIQRIINHKRYEHTKRCIEVKYQNIIKRIFQLYC